MKNFTLKMKSALLGLLAVFAMATPSNAKITGVSDLFGKYKFSATIEYTAAGKSYEGQFKESSDVEIKKHEIYDGQIVGLAGRQNGQLINAWDNEKQTLNITNPSQGGVWGDLYMANEKGDYPFNGILEGHNGAYSTAYTYNAADGSFSIPDFTLGKGDYQAETFEVFVKFTNVKLTLVELAHIDIVDLAGDWHFVAPEGGFNTMEGSTLPVEFDFSLVAKDETKKAYTATLTLGDFAPVNINASFNGSVFSFDLDSTCLDKAEKIYIVNTNSKDKKPYQEPVTFNYTTGGSLSMSSGMSIVRKDTISEDKPKGHLQWYMAGAAKRKGGDAVEQGWVGTFNFKAEAVHAIKPEVFTPQADFTMKVVETPNGFLVTEMFGEALPQGGFSFEPDANDPSKATIPEGLRYLKTINPGASYLILGDMNGSTGVINLKKNADNTISMDNLGILLYDFNTAKSEPAAAYVGVVGNLEAAPVAPEFSWAQTFKVTANVQVYEEAYEFPTEFYMTVVNNEATGGFMMTHFLGNDISQLNYGGAGFTVSESDPMKAEIKGGSTLKAIVLGSTYLVLGDMNAQDSPVKITADADGNLTIDNFSVLLKDWTSNTTSTAAFYTKVKATPVPTGIESVEKEVAKVWVKNGVVCLDKAQAVQVYDFSGKNVFSGVTAEVNGLVKGLYIVKTATGVAKVIVR